MTDKLPKNQEIVFPEESHFVVQEILKKYKLFRKTEQIMSGLAQEMSKATTFKEKKEIAERQPERKLATIIKRIAEEKISLGDFPKHLQQIFNITPKIAKELAQDLEKNILAFAKNVVIEREVIPPAERPLVKPLPVAPPPEEPLETPPPKAALQKEEKSVPREEDIYREPVE